MRKPAVQIVAAAIGLATSLAAFNALKNCSSPIGTRTETQIGRFSAIEGQVERRAQSTTSMETVPNPRPLYNQDLIITQKTSSATIQLEPDGPTLKLNENSRFVAERDASRSGAFIGVLLDGSLNVLNPGRAGSFRLFKNGYEITSENMDQKEIPIITNQPTDNSNAATTTPGTSSPTPQPIVITPTQRIETIATPPTINSDSISASGSISSAVSSGASSPPHEVLTNEEIIHSMKMQTGVFQRCYLNYIHRLGVNSAKKPSDSPVSQSGILTLSFTIQNSGKVTNAKIAKAEFGDSILHNCVTEVTERTRFKAFKGDPVPVLEFPITLQ